MIAVCVLHVKSMELVHTYCKRVNIGTVIVLAHLGHIWGTHEHVYPHQHTVFFSKCACVCVRVCVCVCVSSV